MNNATETLTETLIHELRSDAGRHGDPEMVALCDAALGGDRDAAVAVATAIEAARAADDETPMVYVEVPRYYAIAAPGYYQSHHMVHPSGSKTGYRTAAEALRYTAKRRDLVVVRVNATNSAPPWQGLDLDRMERVSR